MEKYKVTESITTDHCTTERQNRLKEAGFTTDGHIDHLKIILSENGFKLPGQEGEHWGFVFMQKYTRLYLNECDACAEELLMLKEFGMI